LWEEEEEEAKFAPNPELEVEVLVVAGKLCAGKVRTVGESLLVIWLILFT
jgi:hypothetical protein